jgi:hypothetical protein
MVDPASLLQELGFSEYEARAYIALLRKNPLNGYELAKVSGIPRPNIYAVLHKLEERDAVTAIETPSGVHYVPLPPETLTQRLNLHYQHILSQTQQSLQAAAVAEDSEVIWNLRGYETILQKAQVLIDSAQESVMLGVWQPESAILSGATQSAQARGIDLITLCLQVCPAKCGNCRDPVFRYHVPPSSAQRWLIVVRDEVELLFSNLTPDQSSAVFSQQMNMVQMASWYIRHSVALGAILSDIGEQFGSALSADTLAALEAIIPGHASNWLDYMLALVRDGDKPV